MNFISCNEDRIIEDKTPMSFDESVTSKNIRLENGRLHFISIEQFEKIYQDLDNKEEDYTIEFLLPFYQNGFISLRPKVTKKYEDVFENQLKNRDISILSKTDLSNPSFVTLSEEENDESIADLIDETEEIIGDDTFSCLLNENGEVVVGDLIYKYTDVGLFTVDTENEVELNKYLDSENVSTNLLKPTSYSTAENFISKNGGISNERTSSTRISSFIKVNPLVNYLIPKISKAYTKSQKSEEKYSENPTTQDFTKIVQSISECEPTKGIFGNMFGMNRVCKDKYENKRRVKVKAFNYNYVLVYKTGTKVVHQYKGWTGFWRTEKCDEIALGVDYIQFEYNYNNILNNTLNNINKSNRFLTTSDNLRYDMLYVSGSYNQYYYKMNNYPEIFQDDIVLELFLGNSFLDQQLEMAIHEVNKQLTTDNLNKLFWKTTWDQSNDFLKKFSLEFNAANNNNRTLLAKSLKNQKLLVQKSMFSHGYNLGTKKRTFDVGGEVAINFNPDNNFSISATSGNTLVKPSAMRGKIYGICRNGDKWHGKKFTFK
ncbi:MAG: hypothetical protein H6604_02065 [Flavobacteriales bacterium]|nr:hypothetical protein [Flavobacteriales bacterium]